jgi:hypothetical protein
VIVNTGVEGTWKVIAVAYFMYYPRVYPQKAVGIAGLRDEV